MKKTTLFRSAFSMVELIFVIVVLGIVASIGSEIIAKVYQSYIVQRAQYSANIKTELALNQIANRLRYAIRSTRGYREDNKTDTFHLLSSEVVIPEDVAVFQWVAYDGESFEAAATPGWSGFCDLNSSTATVIATPGSDLNLSETINNHLDRNLSALTPAIYFWKSAEHNVSGMTDTNITLASPLTGGMREQYKIARTSYAIVDEGDTLVLYYNFSPTSGADINGNIMKSSILLRGASNFRFKAKGSSVWIKICREEEIGDGSTVNNTVHSCKEKVVLP